MIRYFLNEDGAAMIGGSIGDQLTPSELFGEWCADNEKAFTSNEEDHPKETLDAHVFLTVNFYEVVDK